MVSHDGPWNTPNAMENLRDLLAPDEEDDGHVYGSALNPRSLHGDKKKELARPNAKIEVKTNNRDAKGGAKAEDLKAAAEEKKKKDPKNQIWDEQEVNEKAEEIPDDRPQPDFDIIPKQHVGTEDVFLGLSDRDASSAHCDALLVKVWLPNT